MKKNLFIFLIAFTIFSCNSKKYHVGSVIFTDNLDSASKIKMAAHLVPLPKQYDWQKLELTAFLHFGINTFTGREWGDGKESPMLFDPKYLNTDQWVSILKKAGFKMVILTAKHHDGFCLWPTSTTTHSVASSSWRGGKGDVVGDLKASCDKYDMKFGVYLSPWDRNSPAYGDSPKYNKIFVAQLRELLGNYGKVDEVWFDGANAEGPNGKRQIYDWKAFYHVIDSLQPQAVKAIMGDDVRWVGNERGLGRDVEWSVTPLMADAKVGAKEENSRLKISATSKDLGSRSLIVRANKLYWYPSEVDVSIRPGWFWRASENNSVKSLKTLSDIYFKSVGLNSVLLLNVPPDARGLINEADSARLIQFGEYINSIFEDNKLLGGDKSWNTDVKGVYEYKVKEGEKVNVFMISEDIIKGQRVEKFKIDGFVNGKWIEFGEGNTIGYKRLIRFNASSPKIIRVTILKCRDKANILKAGAYYAEDPAAAVVENKINYISEAKLIGKSPFTVDFGRDTDIKGFVYTPLGNTEKVFSYDVMISKDGRKWEYYMKNKEFSNIKNNPIPQVVSFNSDISVRYIRINVIRGVDGGKTQFPNSSIKFF